MKKWLTEPECDVIGYYMKDKNKNLTYWWNLPIDELEEMADENGKIKLERTNMKNKCKDCEGKGYYTDVISTGLSDPNDPYHKPHIERCDTCMAFEDDQKAKEYHERHA